MDYGYPELEPYPSCSCCPIDEPVSFKKPPSWKTARRVLSRLPPELRRHIYSYTLIADDPVVVENPECERGIYVVKLDGQERSGVEYALNLLLWHSPRSESDDAHAYFLSNNTFVVRHKVATDILMNGVQDLSRKDYSVRIPGLQINCPGDEAEGKTSNAEPTLPKQRPRGRPPAIRAHGMLEPMTTLPWLKNLHVLLEDSHDDDSVMIPPEPYDAELVFDIIGKLRDLVFASSNTPQFNVIIRAPGIWNEVKPIEADITLDWDPDGYPPDWDPDWGHAFEED